VRVGGAVLEGGRRWWTKTAVGWSSMRCGKRHGEVKHWVARGVVRSSGAWNSFYRAGTARGERKREVTGRRRVESINGDGSSKGRRRSSRFMRGNEEEATAHQFNCSCVETGGAQRCASPAKGGGG
jgi:hypothetical protein